MKTFFQKGKLCLAQEKLWQGKHWELAARSCERTGSECGQNLEQHHMPAACGLAWAGQDDDAAAAAGAIDPLKPKVCAPPKNVQKARALPKPKPRGSQGEVAVGAAVAAATRG